MLLHHCPWQLGGVQSCCARLLRGRVVQAQTDEALAAQGEQQQADADMQASNARQHAEEVAELHRQLQAAAAKAAAAEASSASASQVLSHALLLWIRPL